ncbi:hypothetical protein ASC54_06005 [Yonghaparkia sp. Root332]|nr:hypothetical protein ASC54_06005 [Yonghaparkia sp. Root332]
MLFELYQMVGLDLIVSADSSYIMGVADINPSLLRLQGNGVHLFQLLRPDEVPTDEQRFFFEAFGV